MIKINRFVLSTIVFAFIITISHTITKQNQPIQQQTKTIVERNRFFSATEKKANYNITGINKDKPLIFLLKGTFKSHQLIDEGLSITFEGGEIPINCLFKKMTDLCVVPAIPQDLKMVIECKALPCQVEWIIYQPEAKDATTQQPALNLYNLQDTPHHLLGQITCNDPSVQSLDRDVVIYSETDYSRAYYNNIIYVFFSSFTHGFIFVDVAQTSRTCAYINFTNVPDKVKQNDNNIKDFILKSNRAVFDLEEVPKKDFSIECSAIRLDNFTALKSVIGVSLIGWRNDKMQHILTQKVKSIARSKVNDFTFIFKAPSSQYTRLSVEFQVDNAQMYLINFGLVVTDTFTVDLGETIYFHLKKDQKLSLKIEADNDIKQQQQAYYLISKRKEDIKLSNSQCNPREGCSIEVSGQTDTDNMIYLSAHKQEATKIDEDGKGLFEFQEIQFIPLNKQFKHKIRLGDNIFLRKTVQKGKAYQFHVNSPNVLIYAASKGKCEVPSSRCRQRTSNYHHPFVYQPSEDDQLLINVEGLDNTEFEITVIEDQKLVQLSDGTAFSYTMDEDQQRVDFSFKLNQKTDVTFNLVSPLNALKLYVSNTVDPAKDLENIQQSTDGFIQFKKQQVQDLSFIVSVVKSKTNQKYFSHFTLIASSTNSKQRLQPAVTNYETLTEQKSKDFIFQFDRNEDYILAFSLFNLKGKPIDMDLIASKDQKWDKQQAIKISKDIQFVDLREVAQKLCLEEGSYSCEIFLRITNRMSIPVDFSLTLLSRNAVIELKDGIWQSFPSNYMMSTASSFYFYPRHNNSNILILYHAPMASTRVAYKLWRYDMDRINPAEWPFPLVVNPSEQVQAGMQVNKYINIDREQLNKLCWPNCVVLLSVQMQPSENAMPFSMYEYSFFKIMASNSQVQLPQKQKISFTLGKLQDKQILIDLKYLLNKKQISFYTTSTIGDCSIRANAYSQKQQTCPVQNQNSDFSIEWGEFSLSVDAIKAVLKRRGIEEDINLYLCAAVHSEESCKMTLEYTSEEDGYKKIELDTYEDIKLEANQTKFYEIDASVNQRSKITRLSGFPFVAVKECSNKQQIRQCKQEFKASEQKGKQIVVKTQSLTRQACEGCTLLLKFSTIEPSSVSFHSQSKQSQLQLKEKVTFSDFLNQNENNRYQIHVAADEDLIINIHVQQGAVEVHLTNGDQVNLMKKSTNDQRIIQFHIKSKQKQSASSESLSNPLALSRAFIIYHINITSTNAEKAASYTIGYSSGKTQFFLQDGLIVDYQLEPKKPHSFYYCNGNSKEHVFYTLSAVSATFIKELKIKTYSFEAGQETDEKKEVPYSKPNITKKTVNPTLLFDFPNAQCFQIELTNPTSKAEHVSMGINHQEVVFLPFNHQYPIQLHKTQYLNVLADINNPGFIDLFIKKCDQSIPSFRYTFDYEGFIKGEYLYQAVLDEISSKYHIKANRVGTLYLNIQANAQQSSLLSVKLAYSEAKGKSLTVRPGKHGEINYEFIDSKRANVTFAPVECQGCKNIKYQAISSENEEDLYQTLVCPNAFFGVITAAPKASIHSQNVVASGDKDNPINFIFNLETGISYIGIVGRLQSGEEVYYKPMEIATLWGKWQQQTSWVHKFWITLIVLSIICVLIIWVRRVSRKGYRPLDEFPE